MKSLPIHLRLTIWYLLSLTAIVMLFATGSWLAMKESMDHSIDRDLGYRMQAVVPFIKRHSLKTAEDFSRTFSRSSESAIVGIFVQITDASSHVLYESDVLASHHVPAFARAGIDDPMSRSSSNQRGWPVRVASQRVMVDGVELTVHVVEPLRDLSAALHELTVSFALLVPLALLLTAFAGYWVSRAALAPVEQIRRQADAVDPTDLTTRLQVPRNDDELRRLALTLNAMLSRIERGFRSVEQFTADASHELRGSLAFIITAGDVSLRRPRSHEELTESIGKIVAEARRMSKLVEDLLTLARGDAKRGEANHEPLSLNTILEEVIDRLNQAAVDKNIQLTLANGDKTIQVPGNDSELRRLFMILLDNAIKYTDSGAVRITVRLDAPYVSVTVCDSGIGIDPEALPRIFDRFWRADKVRSRAEGGAGLGLSLAAQIVQRHHGTISAESSQGGGSSFTVRLPAADLS